MTSSAIKPNSSAQFRTRGYVIDEDADLALRDVANGLDALATLCEERVDDVPEIAPVKWGGLLCTFARATRQISEQAAWANEAMATKRTA